MPRSAQCQCDPTVPVVDRQHALELPRCTPRGVQNGIADNLPELQRNGLHWSEVAVAILVDGRDRASASMLEYASSTLQVYDESLLKFYKNDAPVTMHFFGKTQARRMDVNP